MTGADLVAEIRAEFAARPELAAALRRAERPSTPARRRQRPQRPEPAAVAPEPPARRRRWHCGWGGYLCSVTLAARGLCNEHAAIIDALGPLERGRPSRVKSAPLPPRDPRAPDALGRLPIRVRAERVARAARDAGSLTRAEAATAAGLESTRGSLPRVLRWAAERDWIVLEQRGPLSRILPGDAEPPG
jgi:hypothetical protein